VSAVDEMSRAARTYAYTRMQRRAQFAPPYAALK
jgi:hypothetical protein